MRENILESTGRVIPHQNIIASFYLSLTFSYVCKTHINSCLSWRAATTKSSNMGPYRFWKIVVLYHVPPVHQQIKCSSTEKYYWSFVSAIHNKPTWWNTTTLIKLEGFRLSLSHTTSNGQFCSNEYTESTRLSPHHFKIEIKP